MATSMSISRAPRSLSEIVSDLGIEGSARNRKPALDSAELRADSKSLRVKTGTAWIFKSASARTDHRTQAHAALLDGLRVSLQRTYTDAPDYELGVAMSLATDYLGIPGSGTAVKVEHLRKLSAYAEQVSAVKQQCRLPLDVAQEVVHFFDLGKQGKKELEPARYLDEVRTAVGNYLKTHPQTTVEDAFTQVTAKPDTKAASPQGHPAQQQKPQAPLKAKAQTTHIHIQGLAASYMRHPSPDLQSLKPEKRWQLLNLASTCVPDYFKDDGFQWIEMAARVLHASPSDNAKEVLARYVTASERPRILAFDMRTIGPVPETVPQPSAAGGAFLSAMETSDRA